MRWNCLLLALFVALGAGCGRTAARLAVLEGPEQLRQEFTSKAGHPRLVLFLSPT